MRCSAHALLCSCAAHALLMRCSVYISNNVTILLYRAAPGSGGQGVGSVTVIVCRWQTSSDECENYQPPPSPARPVMFPGGVLQMQYTDMAEVFPQPPSSAGLASVGMPYYRLITPLADASLQAPLLYMHGDAANATLYDRATYDSGLTRLPLGAMITTLACAPDTPYSSGDSQGDGLPPDSAPTCSSVQQLEVDSDAAMSQSRLATAQFIASAGALSAYAVDVRIVRITCSSSELDLAAPSLKSKVRSPSFAYCRVNAVKTYCKVYLRY